MAVVLCEMEVNIMDDNMNLNKFLMYYGRIVPELYALKEKAENHFEIRPDDIDRSVLYKLRRTAELLRYVNGLWGGK